MATIAQLTKQKDGSFSGTLSTLALHAAQITLKPETSENDKAPAYRVFAGEFELGAGWKKTSKAGKPYISLKLDDPSFAQPLYCALVKIGDAYQLEWTRQTPRRAKQNGADEGAEF